MMIKSEQFVGRKDMDRHDADDGCEVHPSCLSCPLPVCKDDIRLEWQIGKIRDATVVQLYFDYGYTMREIRDLTPDVPKTSIMNVIRAERKRRTNGWMRHDVHEMYRVKIEVLGSV